MSTIYIAGPMRDIEKYNFTAFFDAEDRLRRCGWDEIFNPARIDCDDGFDPNIEHPEYEWKEVKCTVFKRDVECIFNSDAIYMLKGWENSKGARAEHAVAVFLGIEIYYES